MKKILLSVSVILALFGEQSAYNFGGNYTIDGKIIKCYKKFYNYGSIKREWFFIDLSVQNKIYNIAIMPANKLSSIPLKKGDKIKVTGFISNNLENNIFNAVYIYDFTQKKKYILAQKCFWGGIGNRRYCDIYKQIN